jgi:hypothetical protein
MKCALPGWLLFASITMHAATVIVAFNGEQFPETIQRDVGDGAGFVSTTTGIFTFTRTGGTWAGPPAGTFYAFCIEPREFVSAGTTYTYTFDVLEHGATNIGGMGTAKANLIRELFGRYYPVLGGPIDGLHASAMQIAIWEIVRENSGTLNVSSGNTVFRNAQDPATMVLAQNYLSSLDGTGPRATDLYALTAIGVQDVIVRATPEPVTFVSTGAALIGVALIRRRRRGVRRSSRTTEPSDTSED